MSTGPKIIHNIGTKNPKPKIKKIRINKNTGHFEIRYKRSYIIVAYNLRGRAFRIDEIAVEEKERGKGLGSALVGIVEDIAEHLGIKYIVTSTVMEGAYGFWEKLDYKQLQDKTTDLAIYVKQLSN